MPRIIPQFLLGAILVMATLLSWSPPVGANEEYARQTGQVCAACHLDPAGGGELTAAGAQFASKHVSHAAIPPRSIIARGFRLLIGYLHFLTAIFWFGTILYVHLVLKPAYAAGGLPRGEMRVGLVSMVVMGITGAILVYYRVDSAASLWHSRFGILLLVKVALYLVMVVSSIFVITVIGPRLKPKKQELSLTTAGDLTSEDLASYDGQEGRPAYVAFAGKIYDVTPSRLWQRGTHMGRHHAGADLTEALKQAPHGQEKILAMREVGGLVGAGPGKMDRRVRVFYFMAHMNLTIVLVIILILALWRWGW